MYCSLRELPATPVAVGAGAMGVGVAAADVEVGCAVAVDGTLVGACVAIGVLLGCMVGAGALVGGAGRGVPVGSTPQISMPFRYKVIRSH